MNKINLHIGLFVEPYLGLILNGKKTIESRFSKVKNVPYHSVQPNDFIYLKKSSGPVYGVIEAGPTHYFKLRPPDEYHPLLFHNSTSDDFTYTLESIRTKYGSQLCLTDEFWNLKKDSNYATLIEIRSLIKFEKPIDFKIHKNRQSWIIFKRNISLPVDFETFLKPDQKVRT